MVEVQSWKLKKSNPVVISNQAARNFHVLISNMKKRYKHFSGKFGKSSSDCEEKGIHNVIVIIDELAFL
ncbi:MAG: hypothetical protein ACRC1X_00800 [Lactobacillus panisapium]